ncbi:hypothetical protein DAPPUDRAFT_309437 [Daphnia pulex]|uniref:Uncharacterized protein n=1 Tax=Daphnia pulex TaxID=6669 RepID=E9HCU8_DAPPU|nr:hypothetical protein DAPPUDRAFT_309437 [Daphnia pulex]|eukprot:EFX70415.1 hypothetical protein DAPPUDRAFT_309437 [Daphnia pulex]
MRMEILQHHSACQRMLAVLLLLLSASSGFVPTADEQSPAVENWNDLVLRCRRSADDGSDSVTKEGSSLLPIRPVRRLGSEFLGKRAAAVVLTLENLCSELLFSEEEVDENWLCQCIRNWEQSTLPASSSLGGQHNMDEDSLAPAAAARVNKRGLGAILLSGKRMNRDKWNNNALTRRVMGSEFLGKRAIMGSEFLGKRAIMGSEFLGKRGYNGRSNGLSGPVKI